MIRIAETGFWYEQDVHLHHAYSGPLASWIIKYMRDDLDKITYDFGCGMGYYMRRMRDAGFTRLCGFEGDPSKMCVIDNIIKQDLTEPFLLDEKGNIIFLEVGEHIPSTFEDIVIDNVVNNCCGKLVMSWAIRGQGGDGHVNCLDNDEVIERFTRRGAIYIEYDTNSARAVIDPRKYNVAAHELPWFHTTTFVFNV